MSALGQKQTFRSVRAMSALPPKADMVIRLANVCFVPKADILRRNSRCPIRPPHRRGWIGAPTGPAPLLPTQPRGAVWPVGCGASSGGAAMIASKSDHICGEIVVGGLDYP